VKEEFQGCSVRRALPAAGANEYVEHFHCRREIPRKGNILCSTVGFRRAGRFDVASGGRALRYLPSGRRVTTAPQMNFLSWGFDSSQQLNKKIQHRINYQKPTEQRHRAAPVKKPCKAAELDRYCRPPVVRVVGMLYLNQKKIAAQAADTRPYDIGRCIKPKYAGPSKKTESERMLPTLCTFQMSPKRCC